MQNGFSRLSVDRLFIAGTLAAALILAPAAAIAQSYRLAIPEGSLDVALKLLGRETGADIVSTEPGLERVRGHAVTGKVSVDKALKRMLEGTGYRAIAIDGHSYRIVRGRDEEATRRHVPLAADPAPVPADIVVTASKQRVHLLRYPGNLTHAGDEGQTAASTAADMSKVAQGTPVLQSTQYGAGRNKVFIRGIADSSFNGVTQSTASTYFDDVQLTYSGPDPSLKLYDMQSVEVMEGPQGTLYGSGSIGGVIRLTPNPVDFSSPSGSVAGGVTVTQSGTTGGDLSAILNSPLIEDKLAVRGVAYAVRDGGYIDDKGRGLNDVNRVDTIGGRVTVQAQFNNGWGVELRGVGQRITGRDAQYADRTIGALAHSSRVAQPYDRGLLLGAFVVTKNWESGLELFSATSLSGSRSNDSFDASGGPAFPLFVYNVHETKLLINQESRLSRSLEDGGSWVVGYSLVSDHDEQSRETGVPGSEADIIGVTNVTRSASAFGELSVPLSPSFTATLGARATIGRTDGEPSTNPRANDFVRGRSTRRVDPTAAFSWRLTQGLAVFGRYQSGYRTGGLAVARGVGRVADFESDSIHVFELGLRKLRERPTGFSFTLGGSLARWTDIQADLVNRRGQPFAINLGDARIQALEGTVDWVPLVGLHATGAFLFTHNVVSGPTAAASNPANRRLPETPPFAASGTLHYEWAMGSAVTRVGANAIYTQRSVLGTGDVLDISQGDFVMLGAMAGWRRGPIDLSLTLDNLTNNRANTFAGGNQFLVATRQLTTPPRPRNLRLGVSYSW